MPPICWWHSALYGIQTIWCDIQMLWILVLHLVTHILRPEQSLSVMISLCNFSRSTSEQFYVVPVVTGQTGQTSLIHCLSSDSPETSGFLKQFHDRFVWSLASANCTTTIFWFSSPIWRCLLSFWAVFDNKCQLFLSPHVHLPAPLGGLSTWCSRISVRLNKIIISSPIEYEFFK